MQDEWAIISLFPAEFYFLFCYIKAKLFLSDFQIKKLNSPTKLEIDFQLYSLVLTWKANTNHNKNKKSRFTKEEGRCCLFWVFSGFIQTHLLIIPNSESIMTECKLVLCGRWEGCLWVSFDSCWLSRQARAVFLAMFLDMVCFCLFSMAERKWANWLPCLSQDSFSDRPHS